MELNKGFLFIVVVYINSDDLEEKLLEFIGYKISLINLNGLL